MGSSCKQKTKRKKMYEISSVVVLVVFVISTVAAKPFSKKYKKDQLQDDGTSMSEMMNFMNNFGYLTKVSPSSNMMGQLISGNEVSKSIRLVQKIAGLRETGVLDDETAAYIKRPRCGLSDETLVDALNTNNSRSTFFRRKRYAINRAYVKWEKSILTWRLEKMTRKVPRNLVMNDMRRAFDLWSKASNLQFNYIDYKPREEEVDIVVSFETSAHGDGYNFDGSGGVLAHAFMPTGSDIAGDLHLDEEEKWKTHYDLEKNPGDGMSILWVATHELGHSLGLDHSNDINAIMFPSYTGKSMDIDQLPYDDQAAIKELYRGIRIQPPQNNPDPRYNPPPPTRRTPVPTQRTTTTTYRSPHTPRKNPWHGYQTTKHIPTPRTTTTTTTEIPKPLPSDICRMTFDSVAVIRNELYIFKDQNMWKIAINNQMYGPVLVYQYWVGLPSTIKRIDAAYEKQIANYEITLFSGNQYWVFDASRLLHGYPKALMDFGFSHRVNNVDGALAWGHQGHTYFFSHDAYWKFNENNRQMEKGYPKPIRSWKGVKHPITSAFRWRDGKTYFFKDRLYWSFNNTNMSVDNSVGKLTSSFWFGCPATDDNDDQTNRVDRKKNPNDKKQPMIDIDHSNANKYYADITIYIIMLTLSFLRIVIY
ncbi:hypothetical protein CHUAL_002269 [Chamberlinius hualienensis]